MPEIIHTILKSPLFIFLVIVGILAIIFSRIRRAYRRSDISRIVKAVSDDIASGKIEERQNQPRSLNGMDRIYLPQIEKDYPGINIEELRRHAEVLLTSNLEAQEHQDIDLLYDCGPSYRNQVQHSIIDLKNAQNQLTVDGARIHNTVISQYRNTPAVAEIVFQTSLEARYALRNSNGQIIKGSANQMTQLRFEQSLIYVIDPELYEKSGQVSLAVNCPNCGAPVPYKNAPCSYCGTHNTFIPLKVWVFSGYRES